MNADSFPFVSLNKTNEIRNVEENYFQFLIINYLKLIFFNKSIKFKKFI